MRAALLAAGRGVRMGGTQPKTLIPVKHREAILYYILEGLRAAGVEDLLVVTGFEPEKLQSFVADNWGEASYIRNARYASWGNFNSVRLAVDQSPGFDLMVVNSDVIVAPAVYERVLSKRGGLILAVERRLRLADEDMRVELADVDRVRAVSKKLKHSFSHGEFCGVSVLRGVAARLYADIATRLEWTGETDLYYEDVYARMLGTIDARAAFVQQGEYAEVDVHEDLERAVAVVERFWPASEPVPS